MSQNYTRNTNPDDDDREGQDTRQTRDEGNEAKTAEKAFDVYRDRNRMNSILKKAYKFKTRIFAKYGHLALPELLRKAHKYAKKYDLSDEEYNIFEKAALSDKNFQGNVYMQPNTPLAKSLGFNAETCNNNMTNITAGKMQVETGDLDVVQDIVRMVSENALLHEQIKIQSLTYQDCAPQAITGKYEKSKHPSFSFIHPVVAALFFPRIRFVDERMLLASIGNVVYSRFKGQPIQIQPDYELYYDLITDPNETQCVPLKDSPLFDLRNRFKVQIELWKVVRDLREGRYYSEQSRNFIYAIDSCKTGFFDSPDMSNVRDEGTVLRKLFGAFSLRPTIVSITSLSTGGIMGGNYNLSSMAFSQVTSMPIINIRLPLNVRGMGFGQQLNLYDALEQPDWFIENKMIVPKVKSVIHSRDLVVFYANRRYQSINYGRLNAPFNFTALPATLSSLETINEMPIAYQPDIIVGDDRFHLRTVVFVERAITNPNLIIGSTTGIIIRSNYTMGMIQPLYLVYDPQGAIYEFENPLAPTSFTHNDPIVEIPGTTPFVTGGAVESFQSRFTRRGSIYIYVKDQPVGAIMRPCY